MFTEGLYNVEVCEECHKETRDCGKFLQLAKQSKLYCVANGGIMVSVSFYSVIRH